MARSSLLQKTELALGGLMAVSLPAAMIGGTVAIIQFGEPSVNTAGYVAQLFGWAFTAAFLATFALAMVEWLSGPPLET
jgi:hypothetical protein